MIYNIDTERRTVYVGNGRRGVEVNCADSTAEFYEYDAPYSERLVEQRAIDHPQWQPISPVGLVVQCERRAQGVQFIFDWLEQQ